MIGRNLWTCWSRRLTFVLGAGVLCFLISGSAIAQLTDFTAKVTFSAPVEVPGSSPQVLPAGTYFFRVVDSKVNRNIVRISNATETHVYTTVLAIPTHREIETDETVITFNESPAGQAPTIRAWFYPHEKEGQEFVYPKDRAEQIAKSSNTPVLYGEGGAVNSSDLTAAATPVAALEPEPPVRTMLPTGESQPLTPAAPTQSSQTQTSTPAQSQPSQSQTTQTQPSQTVAQAQAPGQPASLPKTGSSLPELALIGCLCLALGLVFKTLHASYGR